MTDVEPPGGYPLPKDPRTDCFFVVPGEISSFSTILGTASSAQNPGMVASTKSLMPSNSVDLPLQTLGQYRQPKVLVRDTIPP